MSTETTSFGEYVKTLRLAKRLPLTKAAARMGIAPQKLSDIESGRRYNKRISLSLVTTVARAYDVPIAEIIKNTQAAVHTEKTINEVLSEVIPLARMCELLSQKNVDASRQFSQEQESLAHELHAHIQDIRSLLTALRKRHYHTAKSTFLDSNDPD